MHIWFNIQAVFVNGVNITKYNQWASNGNIFILSQVLNGSGSNNHSNSSRANSSGPHLLGRDIRGSGNVISGSITDFLSTDWNHFSSLISDVMKAGLWTELESQCNTSHLSNYSSFIPCPTLKHELKDLWCYPGQVT